MRAARVERLRWPRSGGHEATEVPGALEAPARSAGEARGPTMLGPRLLDLQATAGNAAVAHLVARSSTHAGRAALGAPIQRADDEGSGGGEEGGQLGGGGGPATSSTTIGPPVKSTYSVSGTLIDAANTISARTEAGSETATPSMDTVTDGGIIKTATITVAQAIELPDWTDKAKGTPTQQAEWNRFSAAISAHEDGHAAKDVATWTNAHTKIVGKSEKDGSDAFDKISAAANQANTDYDTTTDHGLKQGTGIDPNV